MKVNWTKKLPKKPGSYWLCGETPTLESRRLVELIEIDGELYLDECELTSLREHEFYFGGWWAKAELPDLPEG